MALTDEPVGFQPGIAPLSAVRCGGRQRRDLVRFVVYAYCRRLAGPVMAWAASMVVWLEDEAVDGRADGQLPQQSRHGADVQSTSDRSTPS